MFHPRPWRGFVGILANVCTWTYCQYYAFAAIPSRATLYTVRTARLLLAIALLLAPLLAQTPQNAPTWHSLQKSFENARAPRLAELQGVWVEIANVQIEPPLNGKPGKSHVLFDPRGIRRPDVPGNPTDWKLTFQKHHPGMQVISDTAWEPTGDHADVRFDYNGDLLFSKGFGGDGACCSYRCRLDARHTLLCVAQKGEAFGLEFRKLHQ